MEKVILNVVKESNETGKNLVFEDQFGKQYSSEEVVKKVDKNYGGRFVGYEVVHNKTTGDYIRSTEDNPHKLGWLKS